MYFTYRHAKTGSSTLQQNLSLGIEDPRVRYANLPENNHGGAVMTLFVDEPTNFHYAKILNISNIDEFNKKNMRLLMDGFEGNQGTIEIISGEALFHLSDLGSTKRGVEQLKEFLIQFFERVFVVAYVRKPSRLLASAFQELVKYHDLKFCNIESVYHRYINLKKYIDVFGESNVQLWNFDPESFPENDILLDFTTRLDLQLQRSKVRMVNESISKEAISILFTYHFYENAKTDFGLRSNALNHQLVELLRGIGSEKFKFSGSFIQRAIAANQADYDWFVSVMGDDFKETPESLNAEGVDNEHQLMSFAVPFIPKLIELAGDFAKDLIIDESSQTVARLVDKIMLRLAHDHR